jgi:phenylalanyl-tRNA synthetase alpha chain
MDKVATVDPDAVQQEALAAAADAGSLAALDDVRVRFLGRRSALKLALRDVRDRDSGMKLNAVRETVEAALTAREEELARAELEDRLATERVDVTLPAELLGPPKLRPRGSLHPSTLVRRDVEDIFLGLGYEIVDGREIETTRYNFDALGFPEWHPARSPRDTLFLDGETVLRTETSPAQIHKMEERRPPIYMISIGRVYRRDTIDATHFPIFHQFEGLAIDEGITMADLKGTLLYVMRELYGPDREMRFRTHYFPFTEPSMEPDVSCFNCGGAGCAICKHSGWIEMGGSGMVDPYLYEFVGWGPEEYTGFAFGVGIERTAQLRYGISGIRALWENDLRFLRQFR